MSDVNYRQVLGDWGENIAAQHLTAAGYTDIVMLNDERRNHPGGDILATRQGQRYLFSVKARDRLMKNGKVNWGYNIYPKKVIAAAKTYDAIPAWLVVRADRRDNTYCSYWGLINEIPGSAASENRVYVSMLDKAIAGYRCLANNVPSSVISQIFADKSY